METLIKEPKHFTWNSGLEDATKSIMSSVFTCPNCRSTLSPCMALTCPVIMASSTVSCQSCAQGMSNRCLAGGIVPHFPLPYVCRHWLQVSNSSPCSHGHSCTSEVPTQINNVEQNQQSPKPLLSPMASWPSQGISSGLLSPSSAVPPKDFQSRFSISSRGGSPEGTLIFPEVFVPLNGVSLISQVKPWTKDDDARVLAATKESLQESGWYYGALSWQGAADLLANTSEGTFLIRDSSSSHCPYALSVQTTQGPASVRIEYEQGKFWLACEKKGVTPQLEGVIELVEFYRALAMAKDAHKEPSESVLNIMESVGKHVWIDHQGKVFSPIRVIKPLKKCPPTLQHLCRLATRSLPPSHIATLPPAVKAFVEKYNHSL